MLSTIAAWLAASRPAPGGVTTTLTTSAFGTEESQSAALVAADAEPSGPSERTMAEMRPRKIGAFMRWR